MKLLLPILVCAAAWLTPIAYAASDEAKPPTAAAQTITDDGVGPIRVGRPLAESFRDQKLLQGAYVTRFYSDGQPLEGFAFANPPAAIYVHGAFYKWGQTHLMGSETPHLHERLRTQTINAVIAGQLPIVMITVESTQLATARGIRVGSSKTEVLREYPKVAITGIPELWEEPTIVGTEGRLAFFFDRAASHVIRVVVYDKDPWQP